MHANIPSCLDRNIHSYKCIQKNKDMLSTFAIVLSLKTASDCSLTYFRPFQKLSCCGPTWLNKKRSTKITFECSFIAQNPLHIISGHQKILEFFFLKNLKFCVFQPLYCIGEKSKSTKNHF